MSAATKSTPTAKKKKREKRPSVDLTCVTCASLAVDLRRLIKKHTILVKMWKRFHGKILMLYF